MDTQAFRKLSLRHQALVAVAVLLDGREAVVYLESDAINGAGLSRASDELAMMPPELRMPYVGTMLRAALAGLSDGAR